MASQQQVLEDGAWCREQQLLFRPGRTEVRGGPWVGDQNMEVLQRIYKGILEIYKRFLEIYRDLSLIF